MKLSEDKISAVEERLQAQVKNLQDQLQMEADRR